MVCPERLRSHHRLPSMAQTQAIMAHVLRALSFRSCSYLSPPSALGHTGEPPGSFFPLPASFTPNPT